MLLPCRLQPMQPAGWFDYTGRNRKVAVERMEGLVLSQYPWLLLAVYVFTVGGVQLLALWAATSTKPWL